MKWSSFLLSAVLACVIALTAQSAAVARTMPDATGQMVICTGVGPTMVYVDENGEPTTPPQLCPDYALSLIVALDSSDVVFSASGLWTSQEAEVLNDGVSTLRLGAPNARAPPALI
ncbi:hypothetical protein [Planktotalea sp.]|uniref:hypothetical protein n=1 Tax=Planktotalea sp. TaxID=2029877 RepID=UPI003D6A2598